MIKKNGKQEQRTILRKKNKIEKIKIKKNTETRNMKRGKKIENTKGYGK